MTTSEDTDLHTAPIMNLLTEGAQASTESIAVGAVVIGRNEGDFLAGALKAVQVSFQRAQLSAQSMVYVDSGSTDESVAIARRLSIPVIELDPAQPFTAARAYNEGFYFLKKHCPDLQWVQFVDGDCLLDEDWIGAAYETLCDHPEVTIVCGHIRERHRNQSPYNMLMDIDWAKPVGELEECAGNAMMRASLFAAVGGFDEQMMAGEEPELSLRIRQAGGRIVQIDATSAVHDARMSHFSQWWQRSRREGNAYAEAALMHGTGPERHRVRESLSILAWGFGFPLVTIGTAWLTHGWSLGLLGLYLIVWVRIMHQASRQHDISRRDASLYAAFCLLSKFPRFLGQLNFVWHWIQRKTPRLIEYRLGSFGPWT